MISHTKIESAIQNTKISDKAAGIQPSTGGLGNLAKAAANRHAHTQTDKHRDHR